MWFRPSKTRKKWQKTLISDVFRNKANSTETFSRIVARNISFLEQKENHFQNRLCKYYSPTSDNVIDIQKQRLWLSHPSGFNDPFDCHTGYDTNEYEKQTLLSYIKDHGCVDPLNYQEGFTADELERIYRSTTDFDLANSMYSKIEHYDDVVRKLMKNKSKTLERKVYDLIRESRSDVEGKIEKLRSTNIRVACFSEFNRNEGFKKNIQMWSHYADNHKGFCIEYDLSFLKEKTVFSLEDYEYDREPSLYLDERLKATIKGGLFPVIYTSSRVNIPVSKLRKVRIDDIGNLHHNSDIDAILYKTYIVKSANWNYEKEWRLIIDGKISAYYENKIPFPYIKRIYLGCKMDSQTINTMIEVGKELNVEVIILAMDNKRFILEETPMDSYNWRKEMLKWDDPFG